jgi:tRNA (guanine-N7-)-methyltransferase
MAKNKLKRFAENEINSNVIQNGKEFYSTIKGNWKSVYFKNNHPIVLELGCGNGEYTIGLAQVYADKNFIGTDIKGSRIYIGSKFAKENNLLNVAFLRTRIEFIEDFFEENEISEIWITFPDPQLKDSREKHRLTHPRFLEIYKKILKNGGIIHLKTDSIELFDYTIEILKDQKVSELKFTRDLYQSEYVASHHGVKTKYEAIFTAKGKKINYLFFKF